MWETTLFCRLIHFYIRGKIILGTWCFDCCESHSILITERRIRVTATFVHEHMMCYHLQLCFQLEYDSLILFYIKNPKQNLQPSLKKNHKVLQLLKNISLVGLSQAFTLSVAFFEFLLRKKKTKKTTLAKVAPAAEVELENCGKLGTVAGDSCLLRMCPPLAPQR